MKEMSDADKVTKQAEGMILVNAKENLVRAMREYDKAFLVGLALHNTRLFGKANPSITEIAGLTEDNCRCEKKRKDGKMILTDSTYCNYHKLKRIEDPQPEWIMKAEEKYGK